MMSAQQIIVAPRITDGKAPTVTARQAEYADTCSKLWKARGKRTDLSFRGLPSSWGPQLDWSSRETVRMLSWAHQEWTAVGNDDVHPRHIQHLSHDAVDAIIDLMMLCERNGYALGTRATLLGLFLPKADGGARTVSLMTTLTRLWAAVRVEQTHEWKERSDWPYF